ncbi:MAG: hypothetical protein F6J86_38970, partial [Symploca sp. SIO1B1]|nr:hypothetical protein [Symploca sp. SIO1B1]
MRDSKRQSAEGRRQKAEGRRQKGRKKVAREEGIISDYPFLDISCDRLKYSSPPIR